MVQQPDGQLAHGREQPQEPGRPRQHGSALKHSETDSLVHVRKSMSEGNRKSTLQFSKQASLRAAPRPSRSRASVSGGNPGLQTRGSQLWQVYGNGCDSKDLSSTRGSVAFVPPGADGPEKEAGPPEGPPQIVRSTTSKMSSIDLSRRSSRHVVHTWLEGYRHVLTANSEDMRVAILEALTTMIWHSGDVIFVQGEAAETIYFIFAGHLDVLVDNNRVEETSGKVVFGEQCLFSDSTVTTFTLRAKDSVMAQVLKREDLEKILERFPADRAIFEQYEKEYNQTKASSTFRIPLFANSDPRFVMTLDLAMVRRTYFPGDAIIVEGCKSTCCVLMNTGQTYITIAGRRSEHLHAPGSVFGELALLGLVPVRTATVVAADVCHVSILHQTILKNALVKFPLESQRFASLVQQRHADIIPPKCLRNLDFFKSASDVFLDMLSAKLEECLFMPGHEVVRENQKSEALYIMMRGQVDSYLGDSYVATYKDGDVFGEMSILGCADHATSTTTMRVVKTCFALILHRVVLLTALEHCPDEMQRFLDVIQERRSGLAEKLVTSSVPDLSVHDFFAGCSAGFLLRLSGHLEVRLFLPGEFIITEGEDGDTMFIVQQGEAAALRDGSTLAVLRAGSIMGEFTALGLTKLRQVTIKASAVCVVWQLRSESLWQALGAFPLEVDNFVDLVSAKLETTVFQGVQSSALFAGNDERFLVYIVMRARRQVVLNGHAFAKERTSGDCSLFFINRGTAMLCQSDIEFLTLDAGSDYGAAVAFGVHRFYMFSFTAKSMCHVITLSKSTLFEAVKNFPRARPWFDSVREREEREYAGLQRLLRERTQKMNMQKYLWANMDRRMPHIHALAIVDGGSEPRLRMVFTMWRDLCRRCQNQRIVSKVMGAAGGVAGERRRGREQEARAEQKNRNALSPSPSRPGCRSVSPVAPWPLLEPSAAHGAGARARLAATAPCISTPAAAISIASPGASAAATPRQLKALPPVPASPRAAETPRNDEWSKKLCSLMACRNGRDLYSSRV